MPMLLRQTRALADVDVDDADVVEANAALALALLVERQIIYHVGPRALNSSTDTPPPARTLVTIKHSCFLLYHYYSTSCRSIYLINYSSSCFNTMLVYYYTVVLASRYHPHVHVRDTIPNQA